MVEILNESSDNVIGFKLSGKLHDEDYQIFVPAVEDVVQRVGKTRILAQFVDFHGWDIHALWDDIKFAGKHLSDIEKIALVGDKKWEEWMAKICRPFTLADIQYFDASDIVAAWQWLRN